MSCAIILHPLNGSGGSQSLSSPCGRVGGGGGAIDDPAPFPGPLRWGGLSFSSGPPVLCPSLLAPPASGPPTLLHPDPLLTPSPTGRQPPVLVHRRSDRSSRQRSRPPRPRHVASPPLPAPANHPATATYPSCSSRNSSAVSTRAFVVIRLTRQCDTSSRGENPLVTWFASAIGGLNATTFCFARRTASHRAAPACPADGASRQ